MQEWWLQLQAYVEDSLSPLSKGGSVSMQKQSTINYDLSNLQLATDLYLRLQDAKGLGVDPYAASYRNLLRTYNALSQYCPDFIQRDIALDLKQLTILLHKQQDIVATQSENLKEQVTALIKNIEQDLTDAMMVVYYIRFLERTLIPVLRKLTSWQWYLASFNREQYAELLSAVRELQDLAIDCIKSLQEVSTKRRAYQMDPMRNQTYKKLHANLVALRDCQMVLKVPADLEPDYAKSTNEKTNFPELARMFAMAKASYFFLYSNYNQEAESRFEQELNKVLDVMQSALTRLQAELDGLEAEVSQELSLGKYHAKYSALYQHAKDMHKKVDDSIPLAFRALDVVINSVSDPIVNRMRNLLAQPEPILHIYNSRNAQLVRADEPLNSESQPEAQDRSISVAPLTRFKKT